MARAKQRTVRGKLTRIERAPYAGHNGNPRWELTIDPGGRAPLETYRTGVDASVGYDVTNHKVGRVVTLTLEGTTDRVIGMTS